jgi:hypothetical protein
MEVSGNQIAVNFTYRHAPTLLAFHECRKRLKAVLGPFGSGKSSACIMEIFQIGLEQAPMYDNVRRSRWIVVRNTYRQLKDTTMRTVFDWFPPKFFGNYNETNHAYTITIPLGDGTTAEIVMQFRALDDPDHVRNLLSLEVTGAWVNEYREIPKVIVDGIDGRIDRYPARKDGGCTYPVILMDSNPPDFDHWTYKMFEEDIHSDIDLAAKVQLFRQPSGLSPMAENLPFLAEGYYRNLAIGKDPDWVKVYVEGEYGYVKSGRPVYKNYSDILHRSGKQIEVVKSIPIIIGMDFALNPSAVFCQFTPSGHFNTLRELIGENMPLRTFIAQMLRPVVAAYYTKMRLIVCGDPAGVARSQTDGSTCYQELASAGLVARPARTNAFQARFGAVDSLLTRLSEGKAMYQLDPGCAMLHKGFLGEYKFPEVYSRLQRDMITQDTPLKNLYSHPHDGLQYAALGYEYQEMAKETHQKTRAARSRRPSAADQRHAHT